MYTCWPEAVEGSYRKEHIFKPLQYLLFGIGAERSKQGNSWLCCSGFQKRMAAFLVVIVLISKSDFFLRTGLSLSPLWLHQGLGSDVSSLRAVHQGASPCHVH